MKKNKLIANACLPLFILVFVACESDVDESFPPVESFSFDETEVLLDVDEVHSLVASVTPEDAQGKIGWETDNNEVIHFQANNSGRVVGVQGASVGDALLTGSYRVAVAQEEQELKVDYKVIKKVRKIDLELEGGIPEENVPAVKYNASLTPSDPTYPNLYWHSGDEEVVTVDSDGNVVAVAEGKTIVTAYVDKVTLENGEIIAVPPSPEEFDQVTTATVSLLVIQVGGAPPLLELTYCDVVGGGAYNADRVVTSGLESNLDYSESIPSGNYEFYKEQTLNLEQGQTFNLAVTNSNGWSRTIVYIDWNRDLDFEDEGERLEPFSAEKLYTGDDSIEHNKDITVPVDAKTGKVRMRILTGDAWTYADYPDPGNDVPGILDSPCGELGHVGIKDFVIDISEKK